MLISEYIIDYSLAQKIDFSKIQELMFFPISISEYFIEVFIVSDNIDFIQKEFTLPIKEIKIEKKEFLFLINDFAYKLKLFNLSKKTLSSDDMKKSFTKEFISSLLDFAIYKKASDIHMESHKNSFIIRFRIDGILQQFFRFEKNLESAISSVLKLISNLDITQKRLSQNGRFSLEFLDKSYDFRVSTLPTIYGESIVIRILDNFTGNKKLKDLGFEQNDLENIYKEINRANGLILVTGPTGSGKTSTLYSILKELDSKIKKIITIEDPVEYKIDNIQQVSINEDIGLTFDVVLRDILRQDPDVIMIGEIRDEISLNIAIQASLTGHLVISTLHTNDSISTINRLLDLKAKPFLIASTLKAVISQRLVLRLCEHCKKRVGEFYINSKCEKCNMLGFDGREIVYEVFSVDKEISSMIRENIDLKMIVDYSKKMGFKSILESAENKVSLGKITSQEALKVIS